MRLYFAIVTQIPHWPGSRKILAAALAYFTLWLSVPRAAAQEAVTNGVAQATTLVNGATVMVPLPGATVRVCVDGSVSVPCSVATIFTDRTGGTSATNPFTADSSGNYTFYAAPGWYNVQISAPGLAAFNQSVFVPITPASPNSFQGSLNAALLNGVYNINQCGVSPVPSWCSGSEAGAWTNAALAACAAASLNDCPVYAPSASYTFTTPIVSQVNGTCLYLFGDPANGTNFNWNGSTSATVFTFNCSSNHRYGFGIRDIQLRNIAAPGTTVGLLLGGTNGAEGWQGVNFNVIGFNTLLTYGNNTWITECLHCYFELTNAGTALNIPNTVSNTGESLSFVDTIFASNLAFRANCILIDSPVNGVNFTGGSFDNCQYEQSQGQVNMVAVHWEDPLIVGNTNAYAILNAGGLNIAGGDFMQSTTSGAVPAAFITVAGGTLSISGETFFNKSSTAMTADMAISSGSLFETGTKISGGITNFITKTGGTVGTLNNVWSSNSIAGILNIPSGLSVNGSQTVTGVWGPGTQMWPLTPAGIPAGEFAASKADFSGGDSGCGNPSSGVINCPSAILRVTADQTITAGASLTAIPGLSFTFPASTALNMPFSCHLLYSQATAAASDSFGVQDVTVAPTSLMAKAQAYISTSTFTAGNLPALTTTTATAIVTFTPSASATVFNADIDGMVEQPSNASTSVFQIMGQFTTNNGTIKRGSFCKLF